MTNEINNGTNNLRFFLSPFSIKSIDKSFHRSSFFIDPIPLKWIETKHNQLSVSSLIAPLLIWSCFVSAKSCQYMRLFINLHTDNRYRCPSTKKNTKSFLRKPICMLNYVDNWNVHSLRWYEWCLYVYIADNRGDTEHKKKKHYISLAG